VVNEPLTFGDAFGSDESVVASDDAATPNAPASNAPASSGPVLNGPVINGDNMTRQSGDPDPPDGKAA
jgi:hypothetical protein